MEIFTRCIVPSFFINLLFCRRTDRWASSIALKFATIVVLLVAFQVKVMAQCNNAITSGNFSNLPVGLHDNYAGFTSAYPGGKINIVDNGGSRGALIVYKKKDPYSLKQTLKNLTPNTPYTFLFDKSLYFNCNNSAQASLNVKILYSNGGFKEFEIQTQNGQGLETVGLDFITPPDVTSVSIIFTAINSNGATCGAVVDNLFIFSQFSVTTTQQNVGCFGQSTGSFTVTGQGGAGDYTASYVKNGTGSAVHIPMANQVGTVNNLSAGTYVITVLDANGCPQETTVIITQPTGVITINGTKTDALCPGSSTGTITLNPTGGTAPYTYLWSNGATTQNISGLPIGSYSVIVTDANGCQASYSVNIMQPPPLAISTAKSDLSCFGGSNGQISSSVSGGTAPYTYSWSNGATTQNVSNLPAGDYTLTVTDSKGCTDSQIVTIIAPAEIAVIPTITQVVCFGGNTGAINLAVSGGAAPYAYLWSTGASSQNVSNLSAGTYTVTVRDSKNCTTTQSITITQPSQITIANVTSNVSCFGSSDGSIVLTPSGGTAPYTYLWNTGETSKDISGIKAGTYSVTVTDANGCNAVKTINVTQPVTLSLNSSQTNVRCFGTSTGAVNLRVTGGTAPFTYSWNNGAFLTEDLSAIPAGTYSVVVTDAKGCTATRTVTITQLPAIALTTSVADVKCFGASTGSINLSVVGGTAPYAYNWNTGATTQDINNLTAGIYQVTVTDANGCVATLPVTVSQPALPLNVSLTSVTNVTCYDGSNGSINISVSGGVAPYYYDWSDGQYTEDLSGQKAGSYSVVVTDANGCTQTLAVTITQPAEIRVTLSKKDPICVGVDNGSIQLLTVTGGFGPYTYVWTKNGDVLTNPNLNALTAGIYEVAVTDQKGCTTTHRIALNDPVPITITVKQIDLICEGSDPAASISLDISGGTGPYTKVYTPIDATTSLLTVTDALGCTQTQVVPFSIEPPIMVEASHNNILCYGDYTGEIRVTVTGGNSPYKYIWTDAPTLNVAVRTGLPAGSYEVKIMDASGCELNSLVVDITQPAAPFTITNVNVKNVTCNLGNDGNISLDVSGATTNYSYLWSNGATTKNVSNLAAGTYTLTITDAVLCQEVIPFEITAPPPIVVTMLPENITCNGANDGKINLTVTGGTGAYSYKWDDLPTGPFSGVRVGLAPGTYGVMVTDANGCTAFKSITLTQPNKLLLEAETTDVDCFGGETGTLTVEINGGTSPYFYNGNPVSSPLVLSNLAAGTVSVIITDKNGCEQTISKTIGQPSALSFTASAKDVSCKDGNDGRITLSGNGGTAPYSYAWSNGATTQNISGLTKGLYSVVITDDHGCTFSINNIVIAEPALEISLSSSQTDVFCFGSATGAINLTVAGGTAPYKYIWSNGPQTEDIANLAAGTYSVLVVDANNCQASASMTIAQPVAPVSVTAVTENIKCFSQQTGTITVTAAGGTSPYQITWTTGETTWNRNGLAAGIYSGTVTDASGCSTDFAILISEPEQMALSISKADNICSDGAAGSAMVNVSGGVAPYTYVWSNGQTTREVTGLTSGNYTVIATDANGCTSVAGSVTISAPAPITITANQTNIKCYGDNSGSISINVTGGNAPYFYEWSNGSISQNLTNLTSGSYSVKVTDINGCFVTSENIVLTEPAQPLFAIVVKQNVTCFGGQDGSLSLTASGGTVGTGYTYLWNDGSTAANRTNLKAGVYSVVITDAAGCTFSLNIQIYQPSPVTILVNKTDVECFGDASGSIQLNVSGGNPAYTYSWKKDNISFTPDLNALTAGVYEVTVRDSKGCAPLIETIVITQPDAPLSITAVKSKDVSCNGGTDGAATIAVVGGTPDYTFLWTRNGATIVEPATNTLSAGVYSVTVYDANGCQVTATNFTISEPPVLIASATSTPILCFGGSTTITASGAGGSPAYSYSLDGLAYQSSPTFTTVAGVHQISVRDLNGCIATYQLTVQQPEQLNFTVTIPAILCSSTASSSTSVVVNITGGTGPYITDPIVHLSGNDYRVTVRDQNGCVMVQDIVISQPNPILVSVAQENITCFGLQDGKIKVSVDGGVEPYSFSIDGLDFSNTTGIFTGLAAGTHTVIARDNNDCRISLPVTLTSPPTDLSAIVTPGTITCYGGTTSATVVATGGTVGTGYSYLWDTTPAQTTATATGLTAGIYTVRVTDANGCNIKTAPITIAQPDLFALTNASVTSPVLCFGETATVTLKTTGGTAPISYTFNGEVNNDGIFTGVTAGTSLAYTITDANGCTAITGTIDVSQPLPLLGSLTNKKMATCFGGNDGALTVIGANGTAPYMYSIDNGTTVQPTGTFTNLVAGSYTVLITDANGCTDEEIVIITQPAELTLAASAKTDALCYGASDGTVTAGQVLNAVGTVTYSWKNAAGIEVGTTSTVSNLPAGVYTLAVTDNCQSLSNNVTIAEPKVLTLNINDQVNVNCFGEATGSATASATGGTGVYTYSWNTAPVQTTATATGLAAGTYTVTAKDANGCLNTQTVTISGPTAALSATIASQTAVTCFGDGLGAVTVTGADGMAPYTYSIDGTTFQASGTFAALPAATYTVTVKDANGCTTTQTVTISGPTAALSATIASQTAVTCFGDGLGAVTVTGVDGVAPYTYSIDGTTFQASGTFPALPAATYTVTVKDANGCTTTQTTVTIVGPTAALTASIASQTAVTCFGDGLGAVTVTGADGVAPYTYSIDGTTFQASGTFSNLPAATYTVTVKDANGCTTTQTVVIAGPTAALTASITSQTAVTCFGDGLGAVTVTGADGVAPYTYSIDGTTFQASGTFSALPAATYTVTVKDANGCTTTQTVVIAGPTAALTASITSQTAVTCFGDGLGSVTVTGADGVAPYTYSIDGTTFQASGTFPALPAATYTVTVKDANGCTTTQTVTIVGPTAALTASITSQTAVTCFGDGLGSVTVTGADGVAPYTYSIDGTTFQASGTFSALPAATYTVTVKDANGCLTTQIVTIVGPTALLTASIASQTAVTCFGDGLGAVIVTGADGVAPYTYSIDGTTFQASGTFSALPAATYTVTVKDANGCTTTQTVTISGPTAALSATIASQTAVTCFGDGLGAVTVTGADGVAPYTYSIDGTTFQASGTFAALPAATYTVTVKDANGCTTTQTVTISGPTALLTSSIASQTAVTCFGDGLGAVTVTGADGVAPYTYSIDGTTFQASETFAALPAATYTVTVKDANGCITTQTVTISGPTAALSATIASQTAVTCFGDGLGSVTVTGADGVAPYTYSIDGTTFQASGTFSALPAATYTVTVKDANGCTTTQTVVIVGPTAALSATIASQTAVTCFGDGLGSVTVTGADGVAPYTYSIDGTSFQASGTFPALPAATYTVTVKDANGCITTQTVTIVGPTALLTASITSQTAVTCFGDGLGAVTVTGADGVAPYTYSIDGTTFQASGTFSALPAATYTVTVKDANGCTTTQTVTISGPTAALSATIASQTAVTCFGDGLGSVTVAGADGVAPYTYSIDGTTFQASGTFSNLPAATYTVTVKDANGCTITQTVTISGPTAALTASITSQTAVTCFGDGLGAVTVTGADGVAPYTYSIDGTTFQASGTFSNLPAATYTVTVKDANGCLTTQTVTIVGPTAALTSSIASQTAVTCFGDGLGAVTVTGADGVAPYTYSIDGTTFQANGTFSALPAATYTVTVKDANGCTTTQTVVIVGPTAALTATIASQTAATCFGDGLGAVTVTGADGVAPYTYSIDGTTFQSSGTFSALPAATYTVTVKDANGCTTTQTVTISGPTALLTASIASQTAVTCFGDGMGAVTVAGADGVAPYTYSIDGTTFQASGTFQALPAATYTVTVKDANGCLTTQTVTISGPTAALTASIASQTAVTCFGDGLGSVTVTGADGVAPYTYSIDGTTFQASGTFPALPAATYTVTVKDANGCTTTQTVTISGPTAALSATIASQTAVTCFGDGLGAVTVTGADGVAPYTYSIDGTTFQASGTFSALPAATYTVTVKDANGCTTTQTVTISGPTAALSATIASQTAVTCFGDGLGSVTVTGADGVAPYTYSIDGTTFQASGTFSALPAATYTVTVKDANGCTTTQTVTISGPMAALSATIASQTAATCFGDGLGAVTVTGADGVAPYTYSIDGTTFQASGTFSALPAATYTVTVKDANGCTTTQTVTISGPTAALTASIASQTAVTCFGDGLGAVTVTGADGVAPYTYSIDGTTFQASGTFSALPAATYTVTIKDANGCTTTQTVVIAGPTALLSSSIASQTAVTCFGDGLGAVTVEGQNGVTPYTYSIDGTTFQASGTFSALPAATYTVTVKDANGCTTTQIVTISGPTAALTASIASQTAVTCFGDGLGAVTVTGADGVAPYTYSIDGTTFQASGTFAALPAATYTVTVKDANGCTNTQTVVIVGPTALLTASIASQTAVTCFGDGLGSVTVTGADGVAPYTYSIDGTTFQASGTFAALPAATYTVTVKDANGCVTTQTVVIAGPTALLFSSIASQTAVTCFGDGLGAVTVEGQNGVAPYTYSIDGTTFQANGTFPALPAATYTVTVKDANGCTTTQIVTISGPTAALTASIASQTAVTCFGDGLGAVTVAGADGMAPYTYSIDGTTFQASGTFAALPAATYTVTVKDANGCTTTQTVVIVGPTAALSATIASQTAVTCFGDGLGSVTVTGADGVAPYTYSIDGTTFQASGTFPALPAATYTVTVKDANGCTTTQTVVIAGPTAALSATITSQTAVTCFGDGLGAVTVAGADGVAPYSYSMDGTTFQASGTFSALPAATYTVTVKDANGCTTTQTVTISGPTAALTASIASQTAVTCFGDGLGAVTVTGADGVAPYTYSIDGTTFQASGTFSALPAATYTVTIKDANGCTTTQTVVIAGPTALLTASITSQTAVTCFGDGLGSVTVTGADGVAPYTYSIDGTTFQASGTFAALPAATYTVTVKDANGCTTTQTVTISGPTAALTASIASQTAVTCFGDGLGAVTVTGADGVAPYTYSIDGTTFQASGTFSALPAATYTVIVKDANGCTTTQTVTIVGPTAALTASITSQTAVTCFGDGLGSVTVTGADGVAPYTYSIDGTTFQAGGTFSALPAATYTVTVKDANGCTTTQTVVIVGPTAALSATIASQTAVTCFGDGLGAVTVTGADGVAPYTYSIDGTTFQASGTFPALPAATYTVTVKDANGCITTQTVTIVGPTALLTASITSQTAVTCFGDGLGAVTVTGADGVAPYTYSIDGTTFQASGTFSALPAATYTVTVKDANGCTTTQTVTISGPTAALSATIASQTAVTCFGDGLGSVTVAGADGVAPYTYSIDGTTFQASGTFSNLPAATYTVTVKDANGCTITQTVTISGPTAALTASITSQTAVTCFGDGLGAVTVTGADGVAPYTYSIDGTTFQASGTFSNLPAATYTVTVKDANGCLTTQTVTIVGPTAALTSSIASQTAVTCFGDGLGAVTVTGADGVAPYTYSIDGTTFQANGTFSALPAATYTVTVKDANGCTTTQTVVIVGPTAALTATIASQTAATCFGDGLGAVTVTGADGVAPYTYSIDGTTFQSSGTFSALPAATYTVTVKDANGCTTTQTVTISGPTALLTASIASQTAVTCFGDGMGAVTVAGADGVAPYTYSIDGTTFQASGTFQALPAATYTVTVKDANGCLTTQTVTISGPTAALTASIASQTAVTCFGDGLGSVTVTGADGVAPYTYSIDGTTFQASGTFPALPAATYTVTVKDANGCTTTQTVTISGPTAALSATIASQTAVTCFGDGLGAVTVTGADGVAPYTYSIDGTTFQASGTFSALPAATYTVTVKDANGCTTTQTVTISGPTAALSATIASQTAVTCFGDGLGSVTVTGADGVAPYTYSIDGTTFQASGTFSALPAATYTVTVKDANGCTTTQTVTISGPMAALSATIASQTAVTCFGDGLGSVTVTGADGVAPYTYSIDGTSFQASGTFSALPAATYTVTVKDANGCTTTQTVTISGPTAALSATIASQTAVTCFGDGLGAVTVEGQNGLAPYTYSIDGTTFQASGTFAALPAATYTVTVKDANGCTTTQTVVTVGPTAALTASITSQTAVTCFGDGLGSVTVTGADGVAPYTYSIDGTTFQASGTFSALPAATYTVTVKDANGCTTTQTVIITQPAAALSGTILTTNTGCKTTSDGKIAVNVIGGTAPYTYLWNNNPALSQSSLNNIIAGTYTVVVTDALGCTITLAGSVSGANCSPVSEDDNFPGMEDTPVNGSVTTNDSDPDGDPLTYTLTDQPENGTIIFNPDGSFTFTPDPDWNGTTEFEYQVCDSQGSCTTSTGTIVIIPVNDIPKAGDDNFTTTEDTPLPGSVATNDSDSDGDPLTYTLTEQPENGTIIFNPDGSFIFTPNPGWNGTTEFEYEVCDAQGACVPATATIIVSAENDPPVAVDDQFITMEDISLSGSVKPNDSDPDGDALNFSLVSSPTSGELVFRADGSFDYIPSKDFNGTVTFEYKVCDPAGLCDNAIATIVVTPANDGPTALDDEFNVEAGKPLKATVVTNDSDPENDVLSFKLIFDPENGQVTFNPDGTFTYIADRGYVGNDYFIYEACDPSGACDDARVTLTVPQSAIVTLTPSVSQIYEGSKATITAVLNMPVSEDVVITIERSGDAVEGEDYNLFENFVTIRIPAGQTTTTEYFVIAASIDDVVEPDEYVFFTITDVNSSAVTIGTGADVIILNQLPPVKEVTDENEANPAIKPDPLISPNGDGEGNDQFIIGNIESFPDNEVIIFNRWGNEVYRINGYNNGDKSFHGSANTGILTNLNKDLPEGVYYYIIYTNDADKNKRLNKGYLILKR